MPADDPPPPLAARTGRSVRCSRCRARRRRLLAQPASAANRAAIQFADVTATAKIDFVHDVRRVARQAHGRDVRLRRRLDRLRQRRLPRSVLRQRRAGQRQRALPQQQDGTFTDVTQQAGVAGTRRQDVYKTGVAVGDYDNDGDLDLYVTALRSERALPQQRRRHVHRRDRRGRRRRRRRPNGARAPASSTSIATAISISTSSTTSTIRAGDNPYCGLRKAGLPDVLPSDDVRRRGGPAVQEQRQRHVHRRLGDRRASPTRPARAWASPSAISIATATPTSTSPTTLVRNFLYRNDGDGTFVDVAYGAGVGFDINGKPQAGMGVDCADVDGNGFPDIFVTNFSEELNTLYMNRGDGLFEDCRRRRPGWARASSRSASGPSSSTPTTTAISTSTSPTGTSSTTSSCTRPTSRTRRRTCCTRTPAAKFSDVTAQSGPALQAERVGRGLAVADFDNDGRLDVAISSVGRPPVLLQESRTARRAATGSAFAPRAARATASASAPPCACRPAARVRSARSTTARSYLSANDVRLHVGVGAAKVVQRIEILWPSGTKQVLENVPVNRTVLVKEPCRAQGLGLTASSPRASPRPSRDIFSNSRPISLLQLTKRRPRGSQKRAMSSERMCMPGAMPRLVAAIAHEFDGGDEVRVIELPGNAERHRQVRRPDQHRVDVRHRQQIVEPVEREPGLDLQHHHDVLVEVRDRVGDR